MKKVCCQPRHRGNIPLALRQMRSLVPWPKTPLSQRQKPVWEIQSTAVQILLERYLHQIALWVLASPVYTDTPHTSFFSCTVHVFHDVQSHILAQAEPKLKRLRARVTPSSCHPWWAVDCFSLLLCSSLCPFLCVSPSPCSSLPTSTCTLSWTSSSMWTTPRQTYPASPPTEESCSLAEFTPHTGYEPKLLDDFHYTETSAMIFHDESGDIDTEPSYSCDAELDDETIGKAISSPLCIQERGESADRRQAYHSHEESLLPAQSFFAHPRTARPVRELSSCKLKSSREMENERIRILLERQKKQILPGVRELQKHELQADSDERSIQELNGIIESQRREIDHTLAGDEQLRRDQLLQEQLSEQNRDLREAHLKSLNEMEELKRFQGSRWIFEKKIDRKSRHYEWTHGQNSGITEWS